MHVIDETGSSLVKVYPVQLKWRGGCLQKRSGGQKGVSEEVIVSCFSLLLSLPREGNHLLLSAFPEYSPFVPRLTSRPYPYSSVALWDIRTSLQSAPTLLSLPDKRGRGSARDEGGGSARDEGNQPWSHHFKYSLATVEEHKLHGQMLTRSSTGGSVIWAEGRGSGDCYSIISLGGSELKTIQKVDSKTSSKFTIKTLCQKLC